MLWRLYWSLHNQVVSTKLKIELKEFQHDIFLHKHVRNCGCRFFRYTKFSQFLSRRHQWNEENTIPFASYNHPLNLPVIKCYLWKFPGNFMNNLKERLNVSFAFFPLLISSTSEKCLWYQRDITFEQWSKPREEKEEDDSLSHHTWMSLIAIIMLINSGM